uniref:Transmembrane protein 256 homolog n=1 Tax=Arion vulgaris TaxID=1028688 RepID=A0A0B6YXH5_9EUPU
MADILADIGSSLNSLYKLLPNILPHTKEIEKVIIKEIAMFSIPPGSRIFIRIAGLSGALAVALGAYGSHAFRPKEGDQKLKDVFDIANKYQFIHTLALLAVPFTRKPLWTGTLLTVGMSLFCGSCYIHAFTANPTFRKITPYGGFLLIFAWTSMII